MKIYKKNSGVLKLSSILVERHSRRLPLQSETQFCWAEEKMFQRFLSFEKILIWVELWKINLLFLIRTVMSWRKGWKINAEVYHEIFSSSHHISRERFSFTKTNERTKYFYNNDWKISTTEGNEMNFLHYFTSLNHT